MGLKRQEHFLEPFCEKHGLLPNKDRLIDKGLSAYHGLHYKKGTLGAFLQALRDGVIPSGSVLVVEEWDRFSRRAASLSARMLYEMWDLDLALGVISVDQIITEQSYNADLEQSVTLKVLQIKANRRQRLEIEAEQGCLARTLGALPEEGREIPLHVRRTQVACHRKRLFQARPLRGHHRADF